MKRQHTHHLLLFTIVSLLMLSCSDDRFEVITLKKELPHFNWIKLNDVFEVYLLQDSVFSMEIEGSREYANNVNWTLEGKELIIENRSSLKFLHPDKNKVKLFIRSDSLTRVKANETCYIETLDTITSNVFNIILCSKINQANINVNCNTLNYWNYFPSGGKITIRGYTEQLNVWNSALMSVDAKNLIARNAMVKNGSKGDCELFVINELNYSINGEGNIYVYNTPTTLTQNSITSSGSLIVLGINPTDQ